jgi:hypothetical protein
VAEAPIERLGHIGPNWFASVMGTGIVANAGATLPVNVPGMHIFTRAVWVVAAVLLAWLVAVVGGHWIRHPTVARRHARNPQMAHFYGAAPMALLTVGTGALLVGGAVIGERAAVDLSWALWVAGTAGGLFMPRSAAGSCRSFPPWFPRQRGRYSSRTRRRGWLDRPCSTAAGRCSGYRWSRLSSSSR